MMIIFNNKHLNLPEEFLTLSQLLEKEKIRKEGTAVALNDKIVRREIWDVTKLSDLDRITVITGAFGG